MPRVCEICGRTEIKEEEETTHDILDVCENCTTDRQQLNELT